jgi:hypothetical protein
MTARLVLAATLALAFATPAHAGPVRGLLCALTGAGCPGAPAGPGLSVVDSAGAAVGPFLSQSSYGNGQAVALTAPSGKLVVVLLPNADELAGEFCAFYLSSDCSGPAYIYDLNRALPSSALGQTPGIAFAPIGEPITLAPQSEGCGPGECYPSFQNARFRATEAIDLTGFTPPFHVE